MTGLGWGESGRRLATPAQERSSHRQYPGVMASAAAKRYLPATDDDAASLSRPAPSSFEIPISNALSASTASTPRIPVDNDLLLDGGKGSTARGRPKSTRNGSRLRVVFSFGGCFFPTVSEMDYDTRLIAEIEKHPELYDQTHRDFKNKDAKKRVWAAITYNLRRQVDAHAVKTVKMRWKSLRDSYVKETRHKMAISSGQDLRPRKNWRYSSAMSFLAPHLAISFPVPKAKDIISDESEDSVPTYFLNIHPSHDVSNDGHFLGALLDLSKNQIKSELDQSSADLDLSRNHVDSAVDRIGGATGPTDNDIDSFFRGLSDTVKKLSAVNQIKIQRDIVNMVLDAKLREIQDK